MDMGGGVVIEVDIRSFFDRVDHGHLRSILNQRVRDGVLRRAIDKWLKAGVLEDGAVTYPHSGTPQGGGVSPLLANIYLHAVVDHWFAEVVKPRLEGKAFLIRYADDFVMVVASERDAQRVMEVLPKRFGKYGLTLHPEKTRVVDFRKPPAHARTGGAGSFDLLGFTHHWGRTRTGRWVVKRKTSAKRFTRAVKSIAQWCRAHRHEVIAAQHKALVRKLKGIVRTSGLTGNAPALARFRHELIRAWQRWLNRRGPRNGASWERFQQLLQHYPLPPAAVVHSVFRHAASP